MTIKTMIMAMGLAATMWAGSAQAQVIGGDVVIDGSRHDVIFLGGELDVSGEIDGNIHAVAGEGDIDAVVHGDIEFLGGDLNIRGTVDGDVDIAGGDVDIDADVADDVKVAGGDVNVGGEVGGSLKAAGGMVTVDARVQGDTHLGGGEVRVLSSSEFFGETEMVGGEVSFEGVQHGRIELEGGEITLSGTFHGDVEVMAEEIYVLDSAVITGRLVSFAPVEPVIAEGATIGGGSDYTFEDFNFGAKDWDDLDIEIDGPWELIGAPFRFIGIAFAASAFLLGMLAVLVAPQGVGGIAGAFRRRPLSSGLVGFIAVPMSVILVSVMTVILALTVVGALLIPLLWLAIYPLVMWLAFAFGGIAVGDLIFNRQRNDGRMGLGMRALSFLLVMGIVVALGVIPGLGTVAGLIVWFIGMGAWILCLVNRGSAPAEPAPEPVAAEGEAV